MAKQEIRIKSYNPYEYRYPKRRVVLWETLQLIKSLRTKGYRVKVIPEDGTRLNWRQENGLRDVLSDPVVLILINISINVFTGVLSNLLWPRLGRWRSRFYAPIVLEVPSGRFRGKYDQYGNCLPKRDCLDESDRCQTRAQRYWKSRLLPSPYPEHPEPIFLEHTNRIVGWGCLSIDEFGVCVDAHIDDPETLRRLETGELKGFSFGALIYDSECSVCGRQYVDCNHITSMLYKDSECYTTIYGADLAEVSVVSDPANPLARAVRIR